MDADYGLRGLCLKSLIEEYHLKVFKLFSILTTACCLGTSRGLRNVLEARGRLKGRSQYVAHLKGIASIRFFTSLFRGREDVPISTVVMSDKSRISLKTLVTLC